MVTRKTIKSRIKKCAKVLKQKTSSYGTDSALQTISFLTKEEPEKIVSILMAKHIAAIYYKMFVSMSEIPDEVFTDIHNYLFFLEEIQKQKKDGGNK